MKIEKDALVVVTYSLSLENGELVEKTKDEDPLIFIFGVGQMMPGLEKGVAGMEAGQSSKFTIEPEDAFGVPNEQLLQEVPRQDFPEGVEIKEGAHIKGQGPHGPIMFKINETKEDVGLCDFNHPLAGKRLVFDVMIREVREATEADRTMLAGCSDDCSCDDPESHDCGG